MIGIAALVVVGLPFAAYSRLILWLFYVRGGFLLDAGLLAHLVARGDAALHVPRALGGGTFFANHVTPLFWLTSGLARLLPLTMAQCFAMFTGVCHALPGLGVFWLLVQGYGTRRGPALVAATAVALLFGFGGLALAIARYPHFELLIAGSIIVFAVALKLERRGIAIFCFVVGLLTREDGGFHFFAVLALWVGLERRYGATWHSLRWPIAFAALGVAYSASALYAQHTLFPGSSAFVPTYLGRPPFSRLSGSELASRLAFYVHDRLYIVLPAAYAAFWAWRARNPFIVVGYFAYIPWSALHLFANSALAASLSSYYGFPYVVASFWPLLGTLQGKLLRGEPPDRARSVASFAIMTALSFTSLSAQHNPGRIDWWRAFMHAPSVAEQNKTEQAISALAAERPHLGRLVVDDSIAAVAPDRFDRGDTLGSVDCGAALPLRTKPKPDTVVYFTDGCDAARLRAAAAAAELPRFYVVAGTPIRIATDRRLDEVPLLGSLLRAECLTPLGSLG